MKTLNKKNRRNSYNTMLFVAIIMLSANMNSFAQDLIIKKNGEQIKAKILEVGKTEVKFKYFDSESGPTISINKDEIRSMQLQGKDKTHSNTIYVKDDPMSVNNDAIKDKTSSLKFNFFSPLYKNLAFSYEWMFKPGFNFEVGVGIIGPGVGSGNKLFEKNIKPSGSFYRAGVKFLLGSTSDFEVDGVKYAHPLKGRYLKPEIVFSNFSRTSSVTDLNTGNIVNMHKTYQNFALNLIYGRQLILGNSITAGYYAGIGYGFEKRGGDTPPNNYYNFQRYSHRYFGDNKPFTFTAGVNIGIILKSPGWLTKTPSTKSKDNHYDIDNKNAEQIPRKIR